eukprot:2995136-Rhodomonas_salina.1
MKDAGGRCAGAGAGGRAAVATVGAEVSWQGQGLAAGDAAVRVDVEARRGGAEPARRRAGARLRPRLPHAPRAALAGVRGQDLRRHGEQQVPAHTVPPHSLFPLLSSLVLSFLLPTPSVLLPLPSFLLSFLSFLFPPSS